MTVFDTFMFRNEFDVLECRLEELDSLVDVHILVESRQDFHGRPKPLLYWEGKDRFAQWASRIHHVVVDELPLTPNPWDREHAQRDAARDVLWEHNADDEDVVLISDVDEIPAKRALNTFSRIGAPAVMLMMRTTHSAVDWLYPNEERTGVIARAGYLRDKTLGWVRDRRDAYPAIPHAGWHLSWLGGLEVQREKLSVTCHLELPQEEVRAIVGGRAYTHGEHYDGRERMIAAEVDETWPAYIHQRRCPPGWFRPRETVKHAQ
jgi:beta-1,4-mannosyl-glycoprotein beta-1,4-N-acetylglucosaminyltransferase